MVPTHNEINQPASFCQRFTSTVVQAGARCLSIYATGAAIRSLAKAIITTVTPQACLSKIRSSLNTDSIVNLTQAIETLCNDPTKAIQLYTGQSPCGCFSPLTTSDFGNAAKLGQLFDSTGAATGVSIDLLSRAILGLFTGKNKSCDLLITAGSIASIVATCGFFSNGATKEESMTQTGNFVWNLAIFALYRGGSALINKIASYVSNNQETL